MRNALASYKDQDHKRQEWLFLRKKTTDPKHKSKEKKIKGGDYAPGEYLRLVSQKRQEPN